VFKNNEIGAAAPWDWKTSKEKSHMLEQEDVPDLVLDLEQRIDMMQNMGDEELGSFNRLDWILLVVFAVIIPVIAMELAR
jgi:hypothetical protein